MKFEINLPVRILSGLTFFEMGDNISYDDIKRHDISFADIRRGEKVL